MENFREFKTQDIFGDEIRIEVDERHPKEMFPDLTDMIVDTPEDFIIVGFEITSHDGYTASVALDLEEARGIESVLERILELLKEEK